MSITVENIQNALRELLDPVTGLNYVEGKSARNIKIDGADVALEIVLGYPGKSLTESIRRQVIDRLKQLPGIGNISANVYSKIVSHSAQRGVKLVPGIKNIIAVASGKGGVGKSTTAVNLALALAAEGASVGMLDADIYGPSQPMMLGITGRPASKDGKTMEPLEGHGIQAMSVGFLIDPETPMVWRGPMVTQALEQLLNETNWNDLDYLVVDLPPGTGDIQLTLIQKTPLDGAVIVSTPQEVALADARRAHALFQKVGVPTLGLIENMSGDVFGRGGAKAEAKRLGVAFMGEIPLAAAVRASGDAGAPAALTPGPAADSFADLADQVGAALKL